IAAARRGHRVVVASGPAVAVTPLFQAAGKEPGLRFALIATLRREVNPLDDLRSLRALLRLLRATRFDIIHTHTSKAGALGRIAAALAGRRTALLHQPHGHLFYGYYGRFGTAALLLAERLLAPLSRIIVTLSWRGAEEHLSRGVGRPDQFRVIRSGIDLRPLRLARTARPGCRARLGLAPEEIVVGCLARLEPIKGVDELLEGFLIAARNRPRLRLFLGGDGPMRDRLTERAAASGLGDRVTVTSRWVVPEEVLPAFDCFVLASRNEGMGRALVEAMAAGLPVIASAVGGVPEVLEEGRDGLLIPPGDAEAVALAIARLADDPALRLEMGRRARRRALVFGAGRMGRALLRLYREVAP
ncbi:MAG TPA: glycosyltransferase family 4 protein, partial [Candidatus Polarisedimenticolia bacterium]